MSIERKAKDFRLRKDDLMKQTFATFTSIAQQMKTCENSNQELAKQNILRRDCLEFLRLNQQLLLLNNELKKEVIFNEDAVQVNDQHRLSEKDLLERKNNIQVSFEGRQAEVERNRVQNIPQQQYQFQQVQPSPSNYNQGHQGGPSPVAQNSIPGQYPQQGQNNKVNPGYARQQVPQTQQQLQQQQQQQQQQQFYQNNIIPQQQQQQEVHQQQQQQTQFYGQPKQ